MTVLMLHNRYRTLGGEERAVEDLVWLVREHLGEKVELLVRDSSALSRRAAATGLLRGGLDPEEVTAAVRRTGADIVHAHNLLPSFGWRALAAARAAGAKTVLHLHNYRLVCAVATCVDPAGEDCTRCHGRNTAPGVRLGCRGSRGEGMLYAGALAAWQTRTLELADVIVVPSDAAADRLRALGLEVARARIVPHLVRQRGELRPSYAPDGPALVVSRLAPEKGVEVALAACYEAGVGLIVAGDGPEAAPLRQMASSIGLTVIEGADGAAPTAGQVRFTGRVPAPVLGRLRALSSVELVPSRAHETFGLAAVEALAAGLPVVASSVGALASLPAPVRLVPPGDAAALAGSLRLSRGDAAAAASGPAVAAELAGVAVVAPPLELTYGAARAA